MLDNKAFNNKLNGVITSAKSQRDSIQVLIESGLDEYDSCGNAGQLSRLLAKCIGVRSLPSVKIKDYIQAQANLKYSKNKDGDYVFSKASKKEKITVTRIDENWYEWKADKKESAGTDYAKRMCSAIKSAKLHGCSKQAMAKALVEGGMSATDLQAIVDLMQPNAVAA